MRTVSQVRLPSDCCRDDDGLIVDRRRAGPRTQGIFQCADRPNFLIVGYTFTSGGVAIDPSLPLKDAHVEVNAASIAYARTFELFGQSAKLDIVMPYAWLSGNAEFAGQVTERVSLGLADPRFRLSANFYGAPALSIKDYPDYQQDVIVGASVYVWAPWGQYDSSKLVNLGTNRCAIKGELGFSQAVGAWTFVRSRRHRLLRQH